VQVTGIILAAGASRRMGTPKWQAEIFNKSFLDHILDTFDEIKIKPIYAVFRKESAHSASNFIPLINPDPDRGQLSSLKTALQQIPPDSHFIMHLVDRPLVKADTLKQMIDIFSGKQIIIPSFGGRKGHPVLFPAGMRDILLDTDDEAGIRGGVAEWVNGIKLIDVEDESILWNIDTEEELRRIEKIL